MAGGTAHAPREPAVWKWGAEPTDRAYSDHRGCCVENLSWVGCAVTIPPPHTHFPVGGWGAGINGMKQACEIPGGLRQAGLGAHGGSAWLGVLEYEAIAKELMTSFSLSPEG